MDDEVEKLKLKKIVQLNINSEDVKPDLDDSEPINKKAKLLENETESCENKQEQISISKNEQNEAEHCENRQEQASISENKQNETESFKSEKMEAEPFKIEKNEVELSKSEKNDTESFKCEKNEPGTSTDKNKKDKSSKNDNSDNENDEESTLCTEHEIPEEGFDYPLEMDSSDMLDEIDLEEGLPTVTERYFTPYYQIDVQKPNDDICIRIHSNRICMISLAPSHTIFQENKTIQSCNYKVSEKLDRTKNKVSGKAKHGAQPLQSNSNLCCLTCTDGSSYMVKCCMIGKLIEVNERLIENPELLRKEPHFGGYIALVLPNLKHLDKTREKLLTQELYEEAIKKRKEKNDGKEQTNDETEKKEKIITEKVDTIEESVKDSQINNQDKDIENIKKEDIKEEKPVNTESIKEEDKAYKECINSQTVTIKKEEQIEEGIVSMEVES